MDAEMERLRRIMQLVEEDEACAEMKRESERARWEFETYTDSLPEAQRDFLWRYPGALYYLYHWTLGVACRHMRFPEETE